jgi:small conductance mechanosensitive channel
MAGELVRCGQTGIHPRPIAPAPVTSSRVAAQTPPAAGPPSCAADSGTWCSTVYDWTHNDLFARSADRLVDGGLAVLLILVLAVLVRALLHRAITKAVQGAANGPVRVAGLIRRRAGLRVIAAPLLSERRAQRANTIGSVLRSVVSVLVLVVSSIMILSEFGLNLAPVLASAGIVGVAVGFGAQNLVRDFLSGMFMLLEDQYGVGDIVDLGAASGTVEAVGPRITTLRDVRGTVWHVRNGEIQRVGNKTQGYGVAVVDLPLALQADIGMAGEIADQLAGEVVSRPEFAPDVLEPPNVLGVEAVTKDGLTLRVTVKVNPGRQFAVQRALNAAMASGFEAAGLPRPQPPAPVPAGAPPAGAAAGAPAAGAPAATTYNSAPSAQGKGAS